MNPYQKVPNIVSAQIPAIPGALPDSLSVTLPPDLSGSSLASLQQAVFDENGEFLGDSLDSTQDTKENNTPFLSNLAEKIDEKELDKIGDQLVTAVLSDLASRKEHWDKFVKGVTALGINFDEEAQQSDVFGSINHPLLIEAATQFQARAMSELFPASGPVKTEIFGEKDNDTIEQAGRVQDYMNYQLMIEDKGYFAERDQMLFMLPFTGSEFDKQYFDKTTGKVVSRWVRCQDFAIHHDATSLYDCPRYTHILHKEENDIKRLQQSGHYRQIDLKEHAVEDENVLTEKIERIDGIEIQGEDSLECSDRDLFEIHVDYNLVGYEDEDGINLPYIITVDKTTKKVLSVYRNWRENDDLRQKRVWFTHKKFLPGFGFYGFGLFHTIGSLGEAATKILQLLLDAGAFSALQGGFKTKEAKISSNVELEAGVWKDTELTAEELGKSFYTPPFREPSSTLFNLLGAIVELGRRFAATTEVMVGDAATTGPVGTTVALVEQGSKVFSGIHKRLHNALGLELQNIAELNFEQLTEEEYPYTVHGQQRTVFKQDFDGRVDIIPVSDPNIFSSAQRIAMAQAVFQIATQMPDIADRREAAFALLTAMRVPNIEMIFPEPKQAERADPVTELALLAVGRPVKAFLDQNHQAHIMVHMGALQMQQLPPQIAPLVQAHIAEHMGMQFMLQMQNSMQMPLPPVNWDAKKQEAMTQAIPPQMENMIAMKAAQTMQMMVQQMMQQQAAAQQAQQGPQQGAQAPVDPTAAAQIQAQAKDRAEAVHAQTKQADIAAKSQIANNKLMQTQNEFMQEMALKGAEFQHQREMDVAKLRAEMQANNEQSAAAVKQLLDEFRHELLLRDAQEANKDKKD